MHKIKTNVQSYEESHAVLNRYQHFFTKNPKNRDDYDTVNIYSLYRVDYLGANFKMPRSTNKTINFLNSFAWKYFMNNNK